MSIDRVNAKRLMTRFREDPVFFGETVFGGEKEDIKERIGRSPDHADALALTFFEDSSCPLRIYPLDISDGGERKPWCRPDNEAIWTRL